MMFRSFKQENWHASLKWNTRFFLWHIDVSSYDFFLTNLTKCYWIMIYGEKSLMMYLNEVPIHQPDNNLNIDHWSKQQYVYYRLRNEYQLLFIYKDTHTKKKLITGQTMSYNCLNFQQWYTFLNLTIFIFHTVCINSYS